ncbi:hypothetical protein [Mucilaginibacter psychrotolerans]|uniref:Uncharacterized protein n=1 Tax=Mucilaginibacter psychrotolerans TaxID=1524096 RepID=A0A4Y8S7D5_9SPHI|nr:hypothetical protein [Mucilaginibacter psychrotolerans]TFF34377.1 hypothetical protein E2R66_22140 [Mucilaginibacter psychrotolerans]
MTPIRAELQFSFEIKIDSNTNESPKFNEITLNAFRERTSPDLDYLKDAENRIVAHLEEIKPSMLETVNANEIKYLFTEIFDFNVKLEGKPYYGDEPRPEFWGQLTYKVKTEEIIIIQIFADASIAFRTKGSNELKFNQLSKTLTCFLL